MFEKKLVSARFLNPQKQFQEEEQPIEFRRDPLLDRWARINIKRASRVKQAQKDDTEFFQLIESSKQGCFFCDENLEKSTPRFMGEIDPRGRLYQGESVLFPNFFPFSQYHAVGTVTRKHFMGAGDFKTENIIDIMTLAREYFKRVNSFDRDVIFFNFNWNHLPPSGASIIHPHVQLIGDTSPTYLNHRYLEASRAYYENNNENLWERIVDYEKNERERFIASTGNVNWLTSFAPLGNKEVNAVFSKCQNFLDLNSALIEEFAGGLKKILTGYSKIGVRSFNLTCYCGPYGFNRDDFSLNFKLISRSEPNQLYTSDVGYMEALHQERIVESMPEEIASKLRDEF